MMIDPIIWLREHERSVRDRECRDRCEADIVEIDARRLQLFEGLADRDVTAEHRATLAAYVEEYDRMVSWLECNRP